MARSSLRLRYRQEGRDGAHRRRPGRLHRGSHERQPARFPGAESLNEYAHFLQSSVPLLWTVRIVVLLSVLIHVHAAFSLTRASQAARPSRYAVTVRQSSTWSGRLMRVGGVLLLVFLVFHILHFTTGTVLASRFVKGDVYGNVVRSFSLTPVAGFYALAMLALALHLRHGVWSLFQTLGVVHPHVGALRRGLAWILAIVIPIGFVAVPLGVVFGLLS
ncbi:MAG: succinate dehydrogenase cytochrome b subunit [Gemmatimonadales bacterium]